MLEKNILTKISEDINKNPIDCEQDYLKKCITIKNLFIKKINSGMIAGILNGFCYLGSTLSAYGLGLIADMGGWNLVFWLLFGLCVVAIILSVFYLALRLKKHK